MAMRRLKSVWEAVRGWKGWRHVTAVRVAGAILGLVGVGIGVWAYVTAHGPGFDWATFAGDYGANISTTLVGFTLAVLVIDALNEWRAGRERKRAIIAQMGSQSNDFALEALRLANLERWDMDGSLQWASLIGANLQGASLYCTNLQAANLGDANLKEAHLEEANLCEANLMCANLVRANLERAELVDANLQEADLFEVNPQWTDLQGANLREANLQGADLRGGNLQEVYLSKANLKEAYLDGANLQGARLVETNLQGAGLGGANLQGTYLGEANLQGANLNGAKMDEHTILPNSTKWTPGTDMARFTDPNHPNFWRSNNPGTPAYRSKKESD